MYSNSYLRSSELLECEPYLHQVKKYNSRMLDYMIQHESSLHEGSIWVVIFFKN